MLRWVDWVVAMMVLHPEEILLFIGVMTVGLVILRGVVRWKQRVM